MARGPLGPAAMDWLRTPRKVRTCDPKDGSLGRGQGNKKKGGREAVESDAGPDGSRRGRREWPSLRAPGTVLLVRWQCRSQVDLHRTGNGLRFLGPSAGWFGMAACGVVLPVGMRRRQMSCLAGATGRSSGGPWPKTERGLIQKGLDDEKGIVCGRPDGIGGCRRARGRDQVS